MLDPFKNADFIRVGHNNVDGLYIEIVNVSCNTMLKVGTPLAVFFIFQANDIRHYDVKDDLANNPCIYDMFREAMDHLA